MPRVPFATIVAAIAMLPTAATSAAPTLAYSGTSDAAFSGSGGYLEHKYGLPLVNGSTLATGTVYTEDVSAAARAAARVRVRPGVRSTQAHPPCRPAAAGRSMQEDGQMVRRSTRWVLTGLAV